VSDTTVTPLGHGRYEVRTGTAQQLAHAVVTPRATWVHLAGRVYVLDQDRPVGTAGRHERDDLSLAAPMPATVASVHVQSGQRVSRGDLLLTLEAMKMELSIKSPRDGRVAAIACRPGDLVQAGVPLLELEPEPESPDVSRTEP
jgi:biotin carboxyl carrier protein